MYVYCAYCGKQIDTDRQKYYSPSIWSGDTNYYCDMYNCYSKYRDKKQKERFEAKPSRSTSSSSSSISSYEYDQSPTYEELRFSDGSRYVGETVNGKRHGKGTNYFPNGTRYEGAWENGYMNGHGICVYADGKRYEGIWADGKRNGEGTLFYTDGDKYAGNWFNDTMHGHGTYYYASGARYEGEWANNKKQGKGTNYYVNPTATYCGDWYNNLRHGYGVEEIHAPQGTQRYEGEWKEDKRCGRGKIIYVSGTVKEGYFENGQYVGPVESPPQAKPNVEKKATATPDVKMASVSPAATETSTVTSDNLQAEPAKRTRKVATPEEIWDRLLKMTTSEKQEYFKKHHKLTVPAGTEVIPANCFKLCFELHNVVFNEELREIGEYAFSSTRIRGKLVIPKSVEKIGNHAFDMSRTIEKVVLPNDITVDDYAFAFINDLAEVEFESDPPKGVIIGKGAFSRCHKHAMKSKEMVEKIKALNKKAFK